VSPADMARAVVAKVRESSAGRASLVMEVRIIFGGLVGCWLLAVWGVGVESCGSAWSLFNGGCSRAVLVVSGGLIRAPVVESFSRKLDVTCGCSGPLFAGGSGG
jgi:hypothetical protein